LLLTAQAHAFSLDDVTTRARTLAAQAYVEPASNLPPIFSEMQFGDYVKIQPRREDFEWRNEGTPFKLAFYHQGMHFDTPVKISEIIGDEIKEVRYNPTHFDFGDLDRKSTRLNSSH